MSATATASTPSNLTNSDHSHSRPSRLRRLSQLRTYTHQLHFPSHYSASSSSNCDAAQFSRPSYRNSFSHRLSWLSPTSQSNNHTTTAATATATADSRLNPSINHISASYPDSDHSFVSRRTSAPPSSSANYQNLRPVDHRRQPLPPFDSSRSSPSDESAVENNITHSTNTNRRPLSFISRLRRTQTAQNRSSQVVVDSGSSSHEASGSEMRPSESAGDPQGGASAESLGRSATENRSSPAKPNRKAAIRFYPYHDPSHSSKPSLPFIPVSRTLPSDSCMIRVGRYSERDGVPVPNPAEPSDAPVGFKSKVVSRKHCEFLFLNNQWHIKDIGSSSGTFLNHMRLSQPNMVSRLYAIKDGDIVQLGIDFRGGEEMIFRCVRIRVECNRSWQQQPNEFNKNTESLIRNLGKGDTADYAGCRECSICLGSVLRPYQCLFMAACAHVWHYKCISRLIHTPEYPMFQCPNCRAYTDLSAEVDDSNDFEEELPQKETEPEPKPETGRENRATMVPPAQASGNAGSASTTNGAQTRDTSDESSYLAFNVENMHLQDGNVSTGENEDTDQSFHSPPSGPNNNEVSHSASIDIPTSRNQSSATPRIRQRQSRIDLPEDNPMTPRNDSGPLAFDGRAGMVQDSQAL